MDKLISVGLEVRVALILTLRSTAIDALAILPSVLDALIDNISLRLILGELICRPWTTRELAAIDTAAREQAGELRDGDAKELL